MVGEQVRLSECLNNPVFRERVEEIRHCPEEKMQKGMKGRRPMFTVSASFSGARKSDAVSAYTNLICIDIDSGDNTSITDWDNCVRQLSKMKNVFFASKSIRGKGASAIIPITSSANIKGHFEALRQVFERLGLVIDKSCSDVTRTRFISYDANAYYNDHAEVFTHTIERPNKLPIGKPSHSQTSRPKPNRLSGNNTRQQMFTVMKVTDKIVAMERDFTDSYKVWCDLAASLANTFGEDAREFFHKISQFHSSYSECTTDQVFSGFLANHYNYSFGTFIYWARENNLLKP